MLNASSPEENAGEERTVTRNTSSGVASMVQVKIAVYGMLALLIIGTALTYWVEFSNTFDQHPSMLMRVLPA